MLYLRLYLQQLPVPAMNSPEFTSLTRRLVVAEQKPTQWANAVPLGLSGYCLMSLLLGLINLGYVGPENIAFLSVATIPIALVLFTGGLITLRRGNCLDGNMLGAFGMLFVLGPGLELWASALGLVEIPPFVFGAWHLLLGVFMIIWGIALSRAPLFAFLISPLMVLVLWSVGIGYLVPQAQPALNTFAGWLFLVPGLAWGLYAMALNLCESTGIQLPVGAPLVQPKA
jgi:succinate-acetate transporter protein